MRKACFNRIYELARKDRRIFFVGSDLGFGTLKEFRKEMSDRFFMEGVSEANVIGLATGLALEGKIVYVSTIATFLTRRCFEQIVLDASMHNANVRLIGLGGGVVYAPLGPTHEAMEDIAIMRAIPNMTVVAPADADEMERVVTESVDYDGPMYIRVAKGQDPIVSSDKLPFKIGKAIPMKIGKDILIITTGITLKLALEAAEMLEREGISAGVLHMHTIKPFDKEAILKHASGVKAVISVEEHSIIGGLGSAVAEVLAEECAQKKFRRIALPDSFLDWYGSQEELMKKCSVSSDAIVGTARSLLSIEVLP